ncbi:MAG TPA: hypothetical protein VM557_01055, partial [Thermoanaerobaculia bacterium]|nr:hypothetical protein [Thermoanaerobaculia bacterium]
PVSAARRIHVRIYDPFNEPDSVAEVVIEDALTREILGSSSVALEQAAPHEPASDFDSHPAYGQISDLSALLRDGYTGSVLVRITMNDERPFWTFISLTDNATQDVTIITPQ